MSGLLRDFDGSEVLDTEIQDATQCARAADIAVLALEIIRDAGAANYRTATGEVWSPWKGSVRPTRATAAQIEAQDALKATKASKHAQSHPGAFVVAFRGATHADTQEDAARIFDALNWAKAEWPSMSLLTSGAKGAEKLAIRWAQQKGVATVLARADFDKHGRAAPFRVNDLMLEFEPVCVLTLSNTLDPARGEGLKPFGPALNCANSSPPKPTRSWERGQSAIDRKLRFGSACIQGDLAWRGEGSGASDLPSLYSVQDGFHILRP